MYAKLVEKAEYSKEKAEITEWYNRRPPVLTPCRRCCDGRSTGCTATVVMLVPRPQHACMTAAVTSSRAGKGGRNKV